jgi:hypothetical protein
MVVFGSGGTGFLLWCWVFVVVLLNIILYCRKSLCKIFVDLVAVSLVFCMATMERGVGLFIIA